MQEKKEQETITRRDTEDTNDSLYLEPKYEPEMTWTTKEDRKAQDGENKRKEDDIHQVWWNTNKKILTIIQIRGAEDTRCET